MPMQVSPLRPQRTRTPVEMTTCGDTICGMGVLFALVGELLLGFQEAAEAVQCAGFAEDYKALC